MQESRTNVRRYFPISASLQNSRSFSLVKEYNQSKKASDRHHTRVFLNRIRNTNLSCYQSRLVPNYHVCDWKYKMVLSDSLIRTYNLERDIDKTDNNFHRNKIPHDDETCIDHGWNHFFLPPLLDVHAPNMTATTSVGKCVPTTTITLYRGSDCDYAKSRYG